jgi:hypothetical protein
VARAEAGDIEGALEAARTIEDAGARSDALADIAVAQAEAGDLEGAVRTADSIPEKELRARAGVNVALAAARAELRGLARFPLLSQLDPASYRDPELFRATDCYGNGRVEVPKLACLATVYTMIARGFGKADAMIDDFYADPRRSNGCGAGAVAANLPEGVTVDGPREEGPLDPAVVEARLHEGLPVILHGRSPNLVDHFVLAVGSHRDRDGRLVLLVNDPLPDPDSGVAKRRELVVEPVREAGLFTSAAWHATAPGGFVFDRMRLVHR